MVMFQTDRGVPGSVVVSQISPGRKNRAVVRDRRRDVTMVFDQEDSDTSGSARAGSATSDHPGSDDDGRERPPTSRCRRVTPRATRTASTTSSPTPTRAMSGDVRPRPAAGGRRGPVDPDHRCRARLGVDQRSGRTCTHEARIPHRLPARSSAGRHRGVGRIARLRRARGGGMARARRPPLHGHPHRRREDGPGPGRDHARRCSNTTAWSCRRWPTTTTTSIPTPTSARRSTSTSTDASTRRRRSVVPTVGTFVGRDPGRSVRENLADAEAVFAPLVDHAGEAGVKLIIENCVMEGWHPDGYPGNLAYSPELWEWMFSIGLYLNFDPSHLVWIGVDPVAAVPPTSTGSPTPRPRTCSSTGARTGTDGSARPSNETIRGTWDGGGTGCRASARSTGFDWSTRSTRAGSTVSCRSSTRTPCGVAPRSWSRRARGRPPHAASATLIRWTAVSEPGRRRRRCSGRAHGGSAGRRPRFGRRRPSAWPRWPTPVGCRSR